MVEFSNTDIQRLEELAVNLSEEYTFAEKYVDHLQCFYVPFDVEVTDDLLDDYTFYQLLSEVD